LADVPNAVNSPVGRGLDVGFAINNKGYIGLGTANGGDYSDLYEYDPVANAWTQKSSLGFGLEGAVCMVLNSKAYIGISQSSQMNNSLDTKQFWAYDPATNAWARKADFPGADTRDGLGIAINNMGYVGFGLTAISKNWWQYNPAADQWTQKTDFPGETALSWAVGFSLNNKGYVIGQPGVSTTYQCWQYDPATDTWTQKSNYPGTQFILATAYTIGSKGYVMGGGGECWEYDDTTDTWTQKVFFTNRIAGAGFSIGNYGYFGTGSNNGYYSDFWKFAP
jgi:N-acetylneuraminic acid mutarotase